MANKSLEPRDIIRLLGKLKEETPDYPANLVEARKYSFLKQIVDTQISSQGRNGDGNQGGGTGGQKGGSGSARGAGGSGAALGGGSTFLGFSLKMVFAVGAAVVMLTAAYLYRDQIVEYLAENEIISSQESASSPFDSTSDSLAQATPTAITAPTFGAPGSGSAATQAASGSGLAATIPAPGSGNNNPAGIPGIGTPPDRSGPTQGQSLGPNTAATPTPPGQGGVAGALQYLVCVLRGGADSCK